MTTVLTRLLGEPVHNVGLIVGTSVIATITVLSLSKLAFSRSLPQKIIPSPRETQLPRLSKEEQEALPYPPDAFPGARDAVSPYGTIRVYEWGPETGRKVLLIHGISTPCVALGGIARGLVEKGCRVMLFDLWGRGYSDMIDLPLDSRLYTTEILLAITSSSLPWTPGGFSLVGYSLGGGVAADFASYFPAMVNSLVLLAPAGLVRPYHYSWATRAAYKNPLPDSFLEWLTKRRMGGGSTYKPMTKTGDQDHPTTGEELKGNRDYKFESAVLTTNNSKSDVTVADVVQWQINNHEGFIKSFMSSVRHASIEEKHETWTKLSTRKDKVLIIVGSTDPVIIAKELHEDAGSTIGYDNLEWREIDSGHEFPVSKGDETVAVISEVWGL
ncbi:alpha/beta-hydrolase [Mollisia scopiformis]|uniref:Alpha/beta-hydrolase n=1 Tax=Mollisia scopiformis TaxID=149040 RepID=A0A194XQZ3_MOLSC|nr:alpha/beta-hydrolase [Mollisia scopiformis]KUJ22571.1 alpha/beta-hydrolase [Mollisia scopiformis]